MRRILALALTLALLLSVGAYAAGENRTSDTDSRYSFLTFEEVESYILSATSIEKTEVYGELATYYYGEGYIVAQEAAGYSLITKNRSGTQIWLNGKQVGYSKQISVDQFQTTPSRSWTYFNTFEFNLDVAFMTAIAARAALIALGADAGIADTICSLLEELIVNRLFPEGLYISYRERRYFGEIDPWTQLVQWKYVQTLWHGTENVPRQTLIDTWETITYR